MSADISGWDVLAAVGAASGIPALGWSIYTWRAARPLIRVRASNSFPVYNGRGAGPHHFTVTAVNAGGGEVTVVSWGFLLPDGGSLVEVHPLPFSDQIPAALGAGKNLQFHLEAETVINTCASRNVKVRDLRPWIRLATDKQIVGPPVPYKD